MKGEGKGEKKGREDQVERLCGSICTKKEGRWTWKRGVAGWTGQGDVRKVGADAMKGGDKGREGKARRRRGEKGGERRGGKESAGWKKMEMMGKKMMIDEHLLEDGM